MKTEANVSGPNPNINATLTFTLNLPVEDIYCPSLSCDVYDYIYRGWQQPLIGSFTLPIGDCKSKDEKRMKETLDACDMIIDYLNNALGKSAEEIKMSSTKNA